MSYDLLRSHQRTAVHENCYGSFLDDMPFYIVVFDAFLREQAVYGSGD